MAKQIPNLFTLANLFFGCIAIVFTLQNGIDIVYTNEGEQFVKLTENLAWASVFIGVAAIIDFLDGFVARMMNASSEMGKQLDSLADVVSFGAAPGMILYQFLRMSCIKESNGLEANMAWLLPAFIFTCAGAYRLARFNIDTSQGFGFKGAPIPAAGLTVAALPLIYHYETSDFIYNLVLNKWFLYAVIAILSWLMVSSLPMIALKFKDFSLKNNLAKYLLLGIGIIAAILLKWLAVPVIFIAYIILSLAFKNQN